MSRRFNVASRKPRAMPPKKGQSSIAGNFKDNGEVAGRLNGQLPSPSYSWTLTVVKDSDLESLVGFGLLPPHGIRAVGNSIRL